MRLEHNWAVRKAKPTDSCVLLHFVQGYHLAICCSKLVLQSIITSVTISARACHCHCHQSSSSYLSFLFSLDPDRTGIGGYFFGLDEPYSLQRMSKRVQRKMSWILPKWIHAGLLDFWFTSGKAGRAVTYGERWLERHQFCHHFGSNAPPILAPPLPPPLHWLVPPFFLQELHKMALVAGNQK